MTRRVYNRTPTDTSAMILKTEETAKIRAKFDSALCSAVKVGNGGGPGPAMVICDEVIERVKHWRCHRWPRPCGYLP